MTVVDRRAGRVLLVDRAGRALLLHGGDPARAGQRWWFTPGGGLTGAETPAEGAARELFEEVGLRVDPADLGEPILHEVAEFSYDHRDYRQEQDFYLLRVSDWQVDTAGMEDEEQATITEHRWWSPAELDASTEQIFPAGLADLLRRHTDGVARSGDGLGSLAGGESSGLGDGVRSLAGSESSGLGDGVRERG